MGFTWRRARAIALVDCGTFNEALVFASFQTVILLRSLALLSHLMADTWLLEVSLQRTALMSSLTSVAGNDHLVNLWDLSTGRLIKTMRGHTSRIQSLAFSQESALLVSGATDDTIRIWDVLSRPVQPASTATASIKNLGLSAGPGSSNPGGLSLSMSTNGGAIVSSADGRTSATLGIVPKSAADAMAVGEDKNAVQRWALKSFLCLGLFRAVRIYWDCC